jgi:DNA-binding NtrC family response regulator
MTITPILSPEATGGVLIASPNAFLREQVLQSPRVFGRAVQETHGGAEALNELEKGEWQVLFLDRKLPDLDAEELIQIVQQRFPDTEVVLLDSDTGKNAAASANSHDMGFMERESEETEGNGFQTSLTTSTEPLPEMIGSSAAMLRLYQMVRLVARRDTTVLITGASGTGKELVAAALHKLSPRLRRPFVVVNCAAIPETLLESELFGYVRGAFTGAVQSQLGRIQAASGGTLFLDEIGELPLNLQAKLLRFLEKKEVQRLGGTESIRVDVRVVAATNVDLGSKTDAGLFREDLYYRLAAFPVELPLLSDRTEDVLPLARHFLTAIAASERRVPQHISQEAARMLRNHDWPGNVRELQHIVERASILAEGRDVIGPEHLHFRTGRTFGKGQRYQSERTVM